MWNLGKHLSLTALQQISPILAKLYILYICGVSCYASAAYVFNSTLIRVDQIISYESLIVSEQLLYKTTSNSVSNSFWLLSKISETYQCDN